MKILTQVNIKIIKTKAFLTLAFADLLISKSKKLPLVTKITLDEVDAIYNANKDLARTHIEKNEINSSYKFDKILFSKRKN